ncbi:hypothetical protein L1987_35486 [Smallanthus sonchifolius]|uniref:Uncharacterized protein n=1 Tax=Smallanthus sonchifolius TaxID=185202 RepID=A0ACB9HXY1_9ASTR|nr:hypothetical protein L1987_35486 [Smallanthus sonchifolius]
MSILCGIPLLECVYCIACARWAWKRCLHTAGHDSESWSVATAEEFEPVPRLCRYILAVYEDDLTCPLWEPLGGYGIDPNCLILKRTYDDTLGRAPPYLLYLDHAHDIVLAVRGLNLASHKDYAVLLDNKLGRRKFDGGYTLTLTGHSLGSGVAALLAMVVVKNRDRLGNIDRKRVRCYSIAPARCMSLNLAVRYADIINSVVLQASFFFLPCLLCLRCIRDTCTSEEKKTKDPRRLYAPGRLYHIVERKPFRCGRFPPVVRTAVPVDGRFEHIVLSCNDTSDHAIIWIEREASFALNIMMKKDPVIEIPAQQKMVRQQTLAKEHNDEYKAALQRAVILAVPHAILPSGYGTFQDIENSGPKQRPGESWDDLIERLFDKDKSGHMVLKRSHSAV